MAIQSTFGVIIDAFGKNKTPLATSGENIYAVQSSNKARNNEAIFRTMRDGGLTLHTTNPSRNSENLDRYGYSVCNKTVVKCNLLQQENTQISWF
jgi:hypothetical protein